MPSGATTGPRSFASSAELRIPSAGALLAARASESKECRCQLIQKLPRHDCVSSPPHGALGNHSLLMSAEQETRVVETTREVTGATDVELGVRGAAEGSAGGPDKAAQAIEPPSVACSASPDGPRARPSAAYEQPLVQIVMAILAGLCYGAAVYKSGVVEVRRLHALGGWARAIHPRVAWHVPGCRASVRPA